MPPAEAYSYLSQKSTIKPLTIAIKPLADVRLGYDYTSNRAKIAKFFKPKKQQLLFKVYVTFPFSRKFILS